MTIFKLDLSWHFTYRRVCKTTDLLLNKFFVNEHRDIHNTQSKNANIARTPKPSSGLLSVTTPQKQTIIQTCIILNKFCLILKCMSGTIHYVLLCICYLMLNLHLWDWSTVLHLAVILSYCCVYSLIDTFICSTVDGHFIGSSF